VRLTSFDAPDEGEVLFRDPTEGTTLVTPQVVAGGRHLVVFQSRPDGIRLLAFDLSAAERPLEPWLVVDEPMGTRMEVSVDGRWLATVRPGEPATVRALLEDGRLGPATVVPTPGFVPRWATWGHDPADGAERLHLMPDERGGTREVWVVEMDEGAEGPAFSAPRPVVRLAERRFFDLTTVTGDRYLAILRDPGETIMDSMHLLVGGLAELAGD